jgi:hypothetical protein
MSVNRVEWILCWVELELFRDLDPSDTEQLALQARRIYEKYIQLGAELEVHLSPSSVHMLTREVHMGTPDINCFEEAQAELQQLMEAEFPRSVARAMEDASGSHGLHSAVVVCSLLFSTLLFACCFAVLVLSDS